jgi:hypothetical protein
MIRSPLPSLGVLALAFATSAAIGHLARAERSRPIGASISSKIGQLLFGRWVPPLACCAGPRHRPPSTGSRSKRRSPAQNITPWRKKAWRSRYRCRNLPVKSTPPAWMTGRAVGRDGAVERSDCGSPGVAVQKLWTTVAASSAIAEPRRNGCAITGSRGPGHRSGRRLRGRSRTTSSNPDGRARN